MTEITLRLQTGQSEIDAGFMKNLNSLAQQYGLLIDQCVSSKIPESRYNQAMLDEFIRHADALADGMAFQTTDSVEWIREDRDNL